MVAVVVAMVKNRKLIKEAVRQKNHLKHRTMDAMIAAAGALDCAAVLKRFLVY